jgi:protein-tyrosine phosphatase
MGVDLSRHRSTRLTSAMLREADAVLCMTRGHLRAVLELDPSARGKAELMDATRDVIDPIGGEESVYAECAADLRRLLEPRMKELWP